MNIRQSGLQARLVKILFILLIIAAVLNGSVFWLKRVGWIEPNHYDFTASYIESSMKNPPTTLEGIAWEQALKSGFYQNHGSEVYFKLIKEAWLALFLCISIVICLLNYKSGLFSYPPWPLVLFVIIVAVSALFSYSKFGPVMPLSGLRFFSFLFLALLASWATDLRHFQFLAKCLMLFLLIQLLLLPVEFDRGLRLFSAHFFAQDYGDRIVGSMLQPSSLGIMVALSLAFFVRFSPTVWRTVIIAIIAVILVFFSASAMAILLLLLFGLLEIYHRVAPRYRQWVRIGGMVGIIPLFLLLPWITGRWDIMDSLWGRLVPFEQYLGNLDMTTLLFGQGLGVGTNSVMSLLHLFPGLLPAGTASGAVFISDSTPTALIAQMGAVGLVLFYGLLAYAAWHDRKSAVFYMLVAIGSMTINLTELFPVNILLGLMLAHSLMNVRDRLLREKLE